MLHAGLALIAARAAFVADPLYADRAERLLALERTAPDAPRVVFLGTSRVLNGFDAGSVERAAGAPAVVFNFGVPGAGPVTHAVYFRRLLADGPAPDLLLLEVFPAVLASGSSVPPEHNLGADRLTWDEIELLSARFEFPGPELRRQRAAADRAPWSAHGAKLLGRLAPDLVPGAQRTDSGRVADPHGWFAVPENLRPNPAAFDRAAAGYGAVLRTWEPHPGAVTALRDVLALGRSHGTRTVLVLMPEARAFRALYPPATRAGLARFLATLCTEYSCPLIDAREWVPDDQFADGHHLLFAGARTFTDRLGAEVVRPFLRARAPR
jgi:hypothetical protein